MNKPVKAIVDRERECAKRATSSQVGNLLMRVEENQGVFAAILGERCTSQALDSDMHRVLCGLAAQTFNLSRSAVLVLRSGYAVQSAVLARAIYETATTCLYFRSHRDEARNWLSDKSKPPQYATVSADEIRAVLDEYTSLRKYSAVEQATFDQVQTVVPRLYGALSRLSHPYFDVVRHQIYVDTGGQVRWLSLGPDLVEQVHVGYSYLSLATVNVFLIVLAVLLLIEFRQAHLMDWEQLASTWERFFFAHGASLGQEINSINKLFQNANE